MGSASQGEGAPAEQEQWGGTCCFTFEVHSGGPELDSIYPSCKDKRIMFFLFCSCFFLCRQEVCHHVGQRPREP